MNDRTDNPSPPTAPLPTLDYPTHTPRGRRPRWVNAIAAIYLLLIFAILITPGIIIITASTSKQDRLFGCLVALLPLL